jgi:hypothetical protein
MTKNPLKDAEPRNQASHIQVVGNNDNKQIFSALQSYDIVVGARDTYRDVETNTSVRDQFTRRDYEYFRPNEAVPTKDKEIIAACMAAYKRVGIVHNVIDLMGDFGAQGVKLVHPNPRRQRFYRALWKRWNGEERTERALNLLYRCGTFIARRHMGKLTVPQEKKLMAQGAEKLKPDSEMDEQLEPQKRTIPVRYVFLNPLSLEVIGGDLAQFVGKNIYALKINHKIRQMINHPTPETQALIQQIPNDIVQAIKSGSMMIPLDPNRITAKHYKKDDWQIWAEPMTASILDDLMLLEKNKLADLAALDGAISQVRLWKLGDLEKGIFPTDAAVERLIQILSSNPGGGSFDLVWGPDLQVEEYKTTVHQFLGKDKYEPVWDSIFIGLGIPSTLTGSSGGSKGFTNNFVSLQTLVKRLEYGRSVVKSFWEQELELVRQAMGHRVAPKVVFDKNILNDEASIKALMIQLADRDMISTDTLVEYFDQDPEIELLKLRREQRMRKNKLMADKAGPWHAPEKFHEYAKAAVARGFVGLDVEDMALEDVDTPFEKQMEVQKEAKIQQAKNKGQPQQGRPKNSNDTKKRKQKVVKPQGSSKAEDILAMSMWAKEAQTRIAKILNPGILEYYKKTSQRELSSEEVKSAEQLKFSVLANLSPYSDVTQEIVQQTIAAQEQEIPQKLYQKLFSHTRTRLGRELTIDEIRALHVSAYAFYNVDQEYDYGTN